MQELPKQGRDSYGCYLSGIAL